MRSAWRPALVLVALALVAYLPALRGGFIWDDDDYVTDNPTLRTTAGLADIWLHPTASPQYYPMVFTTFWVEFHLWGPHPFGYHLDNVLLHAIGAILLWRVLSRLRIPGCFLAACLFAVHPIMVESVAWITERKNVLSGAFYFAAALVYFKGSGIAGEENRDGSYFSSPATPGLKSSFSLYLLATALFVLALLSKTVTCSLPAALLLVIWWKRSRITLDDVIPLLPMFAIGFALATVTANLELTHVQATGAEWDYSWAQRLLIAGRAVWFYASKVLLPVNLTFVYPKWRIDPRLAWQWAFPVGVAAAVAVLWLMRDRWGRGPLVSALFFVGTLVPALGFFNIYPMRYTFVADHYAYLAAVGLLVPIAVVLKRILSFPPRGPAGLIVILPLLVLTMARANVYRSPEALWTDTLEKNPASWMVHLNLARTFIAERKFSQAWPHFDAQVRLAPELPETHWNHGSSLLQRGRYDEALAEYTEAIRLGGPNPLPQAYLGRGRTYMAMDRPAEAIADFQRALDLKPDMESARQGLAAARFRQRELDLRALPTK
jgi:hypothetical protein